jgi:hypothetical protein
VVLSSVWLGLLFADLSALVVWQKKFQRGTGKISKMELVQKFNKHIFAFMDG